MSSTEDKLFDIENFNVNTLDDEIRVDELCQKFLRLFYRDLVEARHLEPEDAAALTYGADYFLRDFIIADRRENIFRIDARRLRQFGGNWYIVKNVEPNMEELNQQLDGVALFYHFCAAHGKCLPALAQEIEETCRDRNYYQQRIETFWAIEDNYPAWDRACALD